MVLSKFQSPGGLLDFRKFCFGIFRGREIYPAADIVLTR